MAMARGKWTWRLQLRLPPGPEVFPDSDRALLEYQTFSAMQGFPDFASISPAMTEPFDNDHDFGYCR